MTTISLPIIFALTHFIYREQQNLSSRNYNIYILFFYLSFSVTSILLSTYMMFWLDLLDKYDFIDVLSENIFKLISLFICIILSLIFLGIVIFGLIHNLDLSYQSHKSRKNIKSFLD